MINIFFLISKKHVYPNYITKAVCLSSRFLHASMMQFFNIGNYFVEMCMNHTKNTYTMNLSWPLMTRIKPMLFSKIQPILVHFYFMCKINFVTENREQMMSPIFGCAYYLQNTLNHCWTPLLAVRASKDYKCITSVI